MRILAFLATVLVLVMIAATVWTITGSPSLVDEVPAIPFATPPTPAPTPVIISVDEGEGAQEIGDTLEDAGVIESAIQFRVLVELLGYDRLLQAGEYELEPNTPALHVVYRMRRGIVSSLFVTVIEGWRLEEIADALDEQGVITREDFLEAAVAGNFDHVEEFDFLGRLRSATSLEGYLFPATYFYRRDDTAEDVIQQMLEATNENFTPELRRQALDQGLTVHGVLTLASIIEREAQVPKERPMMAQVFLTRLRRGMLLEADPTVQYALAEDPENAEEFGYWKTGLTEDDLEIDSGYNTYRSSGLPPTPIAAPRLDSIIAVIEPTDTNFLYFVATGDEDGSHAFAETLAEHLENVEEYLR
ncbi:MAG: endolytic transglycosylase MltG [Dehalococcoidia bacterium]